MSSSDGGGADGREVAYRLFAAEYDDADFSYSESDEERAPNYVVTPTGARINRLFVVGVLTEVEAVNDEVLRARVVDPTGAFVVYAGQYQPDEMAFLDRAEPPTFVALTGKARTFQPDDADVVYTSVRPESINEVDGETRDRWTVQAAEQTLHRISTMADALARGERGDDLRAALVADGVDESLAAGTAMAIEHYGTTPTYLAALRETALDAARVVAGERDEVDSFTASPDREGATTLADLTDLDAGIDDATAEAEAARESVGTSKTTAAAESDQPTDTEPEPTTTEGSIESDEQVDADPSESEAIGSEPTAAAETEPEPAETELSEAEPTEPEPAEPEPAGGEPTEPEPAKRDSTAADADTADVGASESTESDQPVDGGDTAETATEPAVTESADDADDDIGDFEPGEFEIDDDERERIEDEYGTDFSTGTEVDEPGEADIETPDPDADEAAGATEETAPDAEPEPETASTDTGEEDTSGEDTAQADGPAEEAAEDVDLTDAVMDAMRELNDGGGADREAVIASVVDEFGAAPGDVEDAIQEALMDGRCYEPDEETLTPI